MSWELREYTLQCQNCEANYCNVKTTKLTFSSANSADFSAFFQDELVPNFSANFLVWNRTIPEVLQPNTKFRMERLQPIGILNQTQLKIAPSRLKFTPLLVIKTHLIWTKPTCKLRKDPNHPSLAKNSIIQGQK